MNTPQIRPSPAPPLRHVVLAAAALLLITTLVYCRVARFDFVLWDDDRMLYKNSHVQALSLENLRWMFTDATYNRVYMPLGWLGYAIPVALFGLNPHAHHLVNLGLHLANALLVFAILRRLLRARPLSGAAPGAELPAALAGAILWAVHPLQVEVVAWVGARSHALAALFGLAALGCYLRAVTGLQRPAWRHPAFWCAFVLYALSLLTFPTCLMLPFIFFILDLTILNRTREGSPWRGRFHLALEKAPFLLVIIAPLLLSLWRKLHSHLAAGTPQLPDPHPLAKIMQVCLIWMRYAGLECLPLHLAPLYARFVDFNPFAPAAFIAAALLVSFSIAAFIYRKRLPSLWCAWLCHLIFLVPFLGLTERPFASDRYAYVDSLIWSALLAGGLRQVWCSRSALAGRLRKPAAALAAILLLTFAGLAWRQTAIWSDSLTFFHAMAALIGKVPAGFGYYWRLGSAYQDKGRYAEAIEACDRGLADNPDDTFALIFKATASMCLADAGRSQHAPREQTDRLFLQAALTCDHRNAIAPDFGAFLIAGYSYGQLGRFAEAQDRLTQALALDADNAQTHLVLGEVLWRAGQHPEALEQLDLAIRLNPGLSREQILQQWSALPAP